MFDIFCMRQDLLDLLVLEACFCNLQMLQIKETKHFSIWKIAVLFLKSNPSLWV